MTFEYLFKKTGGAAPGTHCTYCPKSQGEACSLGCATVYADLEKARDVDGIKVVDEPA
jgi:hypothetical protein